MMENTVGNGNITGTQREIVTKSLVKNRRREFDGRSLALDDEVGGGGAVEANNVETAAEAADGDFPLHSHKGGRISPIADKIVDDVLAHPLLWREDKVTPANDIEYPQLSGGFLHLVFKRRKRQRLHESGVLKVANLQQATIAVT